MSEIMERARFAIQEEIAGNWGLGERLSDRSADDLVRVVLSALREPTKGMLDCRPPFVTVEDARGSWRAMIDEALEEKP